MSFLKKRLLVKLLGLVAVLLVASCHPNAPEEDHWTSIQKAGRIVVGTSADYSPYASYDANFALTGFDIDLMREIGSRLGVEVEFKDFAFDGLLNAVRLNQVDVAIAAISVTPEREADVDFSTVYYVGEDALIAAQESALADVRSADALTGLRVGVQNGSVYESWANRYLVDSGLIQSDALRRYGDAMRAEQDLRDGEIDLMLIDLAPAQLLVQDQALKIVGQGLVRQSLAIAVPDGDNSVRRQLDSVIAQLQAENYIAELVQRHLSLDPDEMLPLPTAESPTPEPPTPESPTTVTVTPAPETPLPEASPEAPETFCIDGMAYVQDLTFDDLGMTAPPVLNPGESFRKGWRVQNTGTCPWPPTYGLYFVGGSNMGNGSVQLGSPVPINGLVDIYVDLVAPSQLGTHRSIWQMRNDDGVLFGESLWAGVQSGAVVPPTPTPPVADPSIQLSVNRARIQRGESVLFSWDISNVREVYFLQQGDQWEDNGVAGQGSREVWPETSRAYELRIVQMDGTVDLRQIWIEVIQPTQPTPTWTPQMAEPVIHSFLANRTEFPVGSCIALRWGVGGNFSSIRLLRNGQVLMESVEPRQFTDCLTEVNTFVYQLEVSNSENVVARAVLQVRSLPSVQPR